MIKCHLYLSIYKCKYASVHDTSFLVLLKGLTGLVGAIPDLIICGLGDLQSEIYKDAILNQYPTSN